MPDQVGHDSIEKFWQYAKIPDIAAGNLLF